MSDMRKKPFCLLTLSAYLIFLWVLFWVVAIWGALNYELKLFLTGLFLLVLGVVLYDRRSK